MTMEPPIDFQNATVTTFADVASAYAMFKRRIEAELLDDCVLAHNGGFFDITPEWLAGLELRARRAKTNSLWAFDRNRVMIAIVNVNAFIAEAADKYETAMGNYRSKIQNSLKYPELANASGTQ